jgi:acetyltransferase-like isoleucine patch superfamily enzyme
MGLKDAVKRELRILAKALFSKKVIDYINELQAEVHFDELRRRIFRMGAGCSIEYPWNNIDGVESISIGDSFFSGKGLFLAAYGESTGEAQIVIGDRVSIGFDSQITAINKIIIGNDVAIGSRVFISDHSHGEVTPEALKVVPVDRPLYSKGPVVIGDRAWIGLGCSIMPGVTIGEDSIVGTNAVVTKSFPPRSVIAGNPARVIKTLD